MRARKGGGGTEREGVRFRIGAAHEDEARPACHFVHEGFHPAVFRGRKLHHGKVRARVKGRPVVAGVREPGAFERFGKGLGLPEDVDRDRLQRRDVFRGRRHYRPVEPERIFLTDFFHGRETREVVGIFFGIRESLLRDFGRILLRRFSLCSLSNFFRFPSVVKEGPVGRGPDVFRPPTVRWGGGCSAPKRNG